MDCTQGLRTPQTTTPASMAVDHRHAAGPMIIAKCAPIRSTGPEPYMRCDAGPPAGRFGRMPAGRKEVCAHHEVDLLLRSVLRQLQDTGGDLRFHFFGMRGRLGKHERLIEERAGNLQSRLAIGRPLSKMDRRASWWRPGVCPYTADGSLASHLAGHALPGTGFFQRTGS